jgi:Lrp/AsnC family leucine-responsive transcriptional regulator
MKPDIKDKKLLFELDKNSRLSLTDLAKKLKTSKEVIHYRLNKLIDEKVILRLHTIPCTYRFGLTAYKIYLRLHDISKENFDSFIEYLMKDKDVFWIGISKGRWDIMFGIWAKNVEDFFIIQDKIVDKFSKYIQDKELSISRESLQYNRRWLYKDNSPITEFNFGEKESPISLDEEDRLILNELIKNSRAKVIDISEKTKLSVDIVSYRIKKMEKQGIIRGYKCLWNVSKLGFTTCKAFVFFKNITEEKKKEFIDYCKNIDSTINIVITFAPWDLEIMFETQNYESYFKIMDNIKDKFNNIIKFYDSVLITSEPKQVFGK